MIIFRTFAIYAAIAGFILTGILIKNMSEPPPVAPHVVEPSINPYVNSIAGSGIVESADKNIAIGVPEEGIVAKLFVTVGTSVKKGDPLFQIDSRILEAQRMYEQANVNVAKAALTRLEDQWNRLRGIQDPRAISAEELKTKENDVKVAQAELQKAIASVMQTQQLIDRLTVLAPKNGVVLQNNIREGEYVSKNTPTIILGDLEKIQVRAEIDEQNAGWFLPTSTAVAYPKNNTSIAIPLKFERVEPYVLPKLSLTGASNERVDTRVLQVIYSFEQPKDYYIYVGQQVDVFIEKKPKDSKDERQVQK
ncbi:MAG: efflux RND transporter periplasmic adaptor subunit [Candidatus Protochlamydia sp.]|nr:efflux RND transporter periplasmic adaptor subunit [Candidatus Protochlamydia sp.]